jgi:alpha-L-rhamnosidase
MMLIIRLLVVASCVSLAECAWAGMTVDELRCEGVLNPIGIDTLQPCLSWTLNDGRRDQHQSAWQIRVALSPELLSHGKAFLWDSGKVALDQNTHVVYKGVALRAGTRCYWKVRVWDKQGKASPWSTPALWQIALLQSSDWNAKWIGLQGDTGPPLSKDCPRLRKTFVLSKPVLRATASVCGLGFYELYLNGKKASDRVLAPANTPYTKRLLFDTLDVTAAVQQGDNVIGLWLAPGYSDDYSQYGWKWEHGKQAILQLDVVYQDGTTATIVTDASWQAGPSPITFASLYDGEIFDARLETPGWSKSAFAAEGWQPVRVAKENPAKFSPNIMPPIRVTQQIHPVSMAEPKPGVFVFDLGQDIAGWVRIRATGARGTHIVLRHSELVGRDGSLDPWTNRRAKATDTFILRGEGSEVYEPRFTYHGFRYVEVTGYPGRPNLDDLTGCVVHADVQPSGTFMTSDAVMNRIHSNCVWSMLNNFMSIPTDCCMRDERTPCQMDSLAYEDAALCNFQMNGFYTKWLGDIQGGNSNPDWSGDMVFLPWRLYWYYGDVRILEDNYENMRAYVESLRLKTPGYIYTEGFGDWCAPNDDTWTGFHKNVTEVNTSLYAVLARIVGETAAILGKSEDAARYTGLSGEITKAFNKTFFDVKTASYSDGSQTTALLPLALNLVPQDKRAAVFAGLLATIQGKNKSHLDTGIFGTRYLVDVLCDFGHADLAVSLLKQPTYPGFGEQIARGATTLWEQWSFKGGMNSHDHAMFAGVDSSFFTRLAGITALKPGFAQIGIRPFIPETLTFVEAAQDTVKGRIAVRWQKNNGNLELRVTVPVNTSALVSIPASDKNAVTENGQSVEKSDGVKFIGMKGDCAIVSVGSGDYYFVIRMRQP